MERKSLNLPLANSGLSGRYKNVIRDDEHEKKYKRVNVGIPTITPSHAEIKLKRDNERLIKRIERLENGPFGIKTWFKCN